MFTLMFCTGCSAFVEIGSVNVPLATSVESEYTSVTPLATTHEETETTFPPTEPESETETEISLPETEPESETETISKNPSVYDVLYENISQFETTIHFTRKVDPKQVSFALTKIEREHPEIFWIDGYTMRYSDVYAEVELKLISSYSIEAIHDMYDQLSAEVENVLQQLPASGTDYEKALAVHDYLITHTEYDESAVSKGKGLWSTAYGCLINHVSVCQGYAQAFQILTNRLGLECGICSGLAKGQAHAWNYIKINQNYYWADVTWDDPTSSENAENPDSDSLHHGYFLIDDELLFRTRNLDDYNQFVPKCVSMEENYFVRQGDYLTEYQFADIDNRLSAHAADGEIEVMFSTVEAYQTAVNDLFMNKAIWNAQIFQNSNHSIHYQTDNDLYLLKIEFAETPLS